MRPKPLEVGDVGSFHVLFFAKFGDIKKADLPRFGLLVGINEEFVFAKTSLFSTAPIDVFHLLETLGVGAHLELAPPCFLAQLSAAKKAKSLLGLELFGFFANQFFDAVEEAAALGREFVEAAA
ncbi:MAG: hypothetical protein ACI9NQ_001071 [Paracoccaceae bacterium]